MNRIALLGLAVVVLALAVLGVLVVLDVVEIEAARTASARVGLTIASAVGAAAGITALVRASRGA